MGQWSFSDRDAFSCRKQLPSSLCEVGCSPHVNHPYTLSCGRTSSEVYNGAKQPRDEGYGTSMSHVVESSVLSKKRVVSSHISKMSYYKYYMYFRLNTNVQIGWEKAFMEEQAVWYRMRGIGSVKP